MKKHVAKFITVLAFLLIIANAKTPITKATETKSGLLGPNDTYDVSKRIGDDVDLRTTTGVTPRNLQTTTPLTHSTICPIVVLIDFPDSENDTVKDMLSAGSIYSSTNLSDIETSFSNSTNSLKNYIETISSRNCLINPTFAYKYNSMTITYIAKHPVEYYRPYSSTNTVGYKDSSARRSREKDLLLTAFSKIKAFIPSTVDVDANDDSKIDAIDFFVPYQDGWNELLWPHKTSFDKDSSTYVNGAYLSSINLLTMPYFNSIRYRLLTHEFLHILGYPDMYIYDKSSSQYTDPNPWTMMSNNKGYPTVRELSRYGTWISDSRISTISKTGSYIVYNIPSTYGTLAYRINIPNSDEFFMVEYRNKNANIYEDTLPYSGLVVYRVNPNKCGNASGDPEICVLSSDGSTYGRLDGTTNRDTVKLTLSSGKDTGYVIDYGYEYTSASVSFNLIKNNEMGVASISSSLGDSFFNLHNTKLTVNSGLSNTSGLTYTLKIGSSTVLSNSTSNTYSWTPSTAGTYKVVATVKNSSSGLSVSTAKTITVKPYDFAITSLTSSRGTEFKDIYSTTLSINAHSPKGNLRYTLKANNTYLLNNSTSSSVEWTPTATGTYTIIATVKDGDGITLSKTLSIKVIPYNFSITSFTSSLGQEFNVNEITTICARANSDVGGVTFKFYLNGELMIFLKRQNELQLAGTKSFKWSTKNYGVYELKVVATDARGNTRTKYLYLYISDPENGHYVHKPVIEGPIPLDPIVVKPIEPIIPREPIEKPIDLDDITPIIIH